MRILFMGSDDLACPILEELLNSSKDEIISIVTQPDRPKGRKRRIGACPVKVWAEKRRLPIMTPEKIGAQDVTKRVAELRPDIIVVAAYGQYITPNVLDVPTHGAINIHPSLLPKYRGASPIQWAIANGEKITGVTILDVSEEMDAGDILAQREVLLYDEDTFSSLKPRLARVGAALLRETLDRIRHKKVSRIPQRDEEATYVRKLKKTDGRIDWTQSAEVIRNRIRGFYPWPGCFCSIPGASAHWLKVHRARLEDQEGSPGEILEAQGEGLLVATGKQALRLIEVQPEGKKTMSGSAYLRGHSVQKGDRLA